MFSGKFNKFGTKRKAKGFAVTWTLKTASLVSGESSWGKSREILRAVGFHGGESEMKAVMRVAEAKFTSDIFAAYRALVYYSDGEKKMIQFAKELTGAAQ